ncbi:class I SAM-dependent methyltransferase [Bordetella sp. N]|uniref:class I SAM-dependent methyltransferase n=1 Tax=Bordetella sp. N TaxID=1746199 RepID=UPI00070FC5EB|nr:class I SAM-dependent methyltransferase [Bordetella sp. N]ALM85276.1 hypothetical protein ASB57_21940 [Bordetella sp. N]
MSRIYNDKVDLEPTQVREFFETRGRNISSQNPLTSIMYQDKNPELAVQRDLFEKQRVLPLLQLNKSVHVLDIGCGIGRWAEPLLGKVASYHGVDFSTSLIEAARSRVTDSSCSFQVLAGQDVALDRLPARRPVDRVIIAGVLIYLNDEDARRTLTAAASCCSTSALIYLREPIGLENRLTLKDFASEELGATYNSIYRSPAEMDELLADTLGAAGFKTTTSERLYPVHLNNRRETEQHIFVFERP